jgi:hypothetical protein
MDLVADVPQHLPQLVMPYNITLNLTTLFSFLPSRLFARSKLVQQIWRRWDQAVEMGMASETASVGDFLGGDDESWPSTLLEVAAAAVASPTPAPKPAPPIAYPGPWAFFISGYMLGIFLMVRTSSLRSESEGRLIVWPGCDSTPNTEHHHPVAHAEPTWTSEWGFDRVEQTILDFQPTDVLHLSSRLDPNIDTPRGPSADAILPLQDAYDLVCARATNIRVISREGPFRLGG